MDVKDSIGAKFFKRQDELRGGPDPDVVTDDYRIEIVGFPVMDLAGHTAFATAFYAAFPDLQHAVEEVVTEGAIESIRFTLKGTHRGDFNGIPATNKPIEVSVMIHWTIENGRVAHGRALIDQLGMMQQLGVIPTQ